MHGQGGHGGVRRKGAPQGGGMREARDCGDSLGRRRSFWTTGPGLRMPTPPPRALGQAGLDAPLGRRRVSPSDGATGPCRRKKPRPLAAEQSACSTWALRVCAHVHFQRDPHARSCAAAPGSHALMASSHIRLCHRFRFKNWQENLLFLTLVTAPGAWKLCVINTGNSWFGGSTGCERPPLPPVHTWGTWSCCGCWPGRVGSWDATDPPARLLLHHAGRAASPPQIPTHLPLPPASHLCRRLEVERGVPGFQDGWETRALACHPQDTQPCTAQHKIPKGLDHSFSFVRSDGR